MLLAPFPIVRVPEMEATPAFVIDQESEVIETSSLSEPIAIVSLVVSSVPMFMVFPAVPVPILNVFTPLPVAIFTASASSSEAIFKVPVEPVLRVKALVVALSMVRAPLSAILLVVKVNDPIDVPVMNEATPASVTLQLSSVREIFPAIVTVSSVAPLWPIKIVSAPASFMVTSPVAERVVKAPVFGVPLPIAPGAAHVAPIRLEALMVPELA